MASPTINWSAVLTGVTQAAIIGIFLMVWDMHGSQATVEEKLKNEADKNEKQDIQLVQIWAILNKNEGIRSAEREEPKKER